ncbi:MAG TPA: hypothetical protein VKU00_17110 [Chthonomonadaceae bacterium]|nr:hypothetical protein [Chthonomonadaceae bacterium]
MYRGVNNLTDLIASPFHTLSICTRSLAVLGLGLITLSPAVAQGLKPQTQLEPTPVVPGSPPVHTTMLPPAVISPQNGPSLDLAPNLDYDKLEEQRQELLNHTANAPSTKSKGQLFSTEQLFSTTGAGYFYRDYPWSWSLGDSNYFQVSLSSDVSLYGDPSYLSVYGSASANGAILGNSFNIANADAWGYSSGGYAGGYLTLSVVGNNIIDWWTSQSVSWYYSWYSQEEIAEHYHVWIGPIPVGGRIGVRGTVGSSLNLGIYGSSVSGGVEPYVALDGFAEAGVDIWFASAGVGGDLTFLSCDFPNNAGLYLYSDANGNPMLGEWVLSDINLNALSGNFYLYTELFGDYSYWTLWSWSGVQFYDTLYWDWNTIAL